MRPCSVQHATQQSHAARERVRRKRAHARRASGTNGVKSACSQSGEWNRYGVKANPRPATAAATVLVPSSRA